MPNERGEPTKDDEYNPGEFSAIYDDDFDPVRGELGAAYLDAKTPEEQQRTWAAVRAHEAERREQRRQWRPWPPDKEAEERMGKRAPEGPREQGCRRGGRSPPQIWPEILARMSGTPPSN